jgi:hypothetical protein
MDIYLSSLFNIVYEDLTLIYDVCLINSKYNPRGNSIQQIAQVSDILYHNSPFYPILSLYIPPGTRNLTSFRGESDFTRRKWILPNAEWNGFHFTGKCVSTHQI